MPLYDFVCSKCGKVFEELVFDNTNPPCPDCACTDTARQVSMPSPLKTGAFPYPPKPGAIHPLASKMAAGGASSTPSCGGQCASCANNAG